MRIFYERYIFRAVSTAIVANKQFDVGKFYQTVAKQLATVVCCLLIHTRTYIHSVGSISQNIHIIISTPDVINTLV